MATVRTEVDRPAAARAKVGRGREARARTQPGAKDEPPLRELVRDIGGELKHLLEKELELAKTELRLDVKNTVSSVAAWAGAGVIALFGAGALVATVILLLALAMPAWVAALIVTVLLLGTAALVGWIGWKRRLHSPLAATRQTLRDDARVIKEDVRWTRRQIA
jgi:uncharacterized membrane protein YqjE